MAPTGTEDIARSPAAARQPDGFGSCTIRALRPARLRCGRTGNGECRTHCGGVGGHCVDRLRVAGRLTAVEQRGPRARRTQHSRLNAVHEGERGLRVTRARRRPPRDVEGCLGASPSLGHHSSTARANPTLKVQVQHMLGPAQESRSKYESRSHLPHDHNQVPRRCHAALRRCRGVDGSDPCSAEDRRSCVRPCCRYRAGRCGFQADASQEAPRHPSRQEGGCRRASRFCWEVSGPHDEGAEATRPFSLSGVVG